MQHQKKLDANDYIVFVYFTLILSLHYFMKCRSRRLAVYYNEVILVSACDGSKMINRIAINTTGNYCLSKSHMYYIASCYYNICSKCPPYWTLWTLKPLANSTFNDHVTQSSSLAVDASFQFVDARS